MSVARRSSAGVTLVELMVVLVLLGLMAAVVGLAWRRDPVRTRDATTDGQGAIAAARHQALASGRAVRVELTIDGQRVAIAALPDGRVIAPEGMRVDPLTGMPLRE